MLLAVSVAGDLTTLGLFDGDEVSGHWQVSTDPDRTTDEWRLLLRGLLPVQPSGYALCSTVPAALPVLRRVVADAEHVVVGPGTRTGLMVRTDNPRELGADRIVHALAASRLHGVPCVAVGLGVATTYDVVTAAGEYVGGVIAPGVAQSLAALGRAGAQLRHVELARPRSVIARNTVEALQSGAVHGAAGQVEGIVTRIVAELGVAREQVTVVATGPYAELVLAQCDVVDVYDPHLALHGLRLAFERGRG